MKTETNLRRGWRGFQAAFYRSLPGAPDQWLQELDPAEADNQIQSLLTEAASNPQLFPLEDREGIQVAQTMNTDQLLEGRDACERLYRRQRKRVTSDN